MKLTNTNKSDDEPYNSGCKMIIPKEDYSSVNNINQQTNTQHYSKNDPWQEQVMISLRINSGFLLTKNPQTWEFLVKTRNFKIVPNMCTYRKYFKS